MSSLVDGYIELGLELNKYVDGLVDAYYGPRSIADKIAQSPKIDPKILAERARELIGQLDSNVPIDDSSSAHSLRRRTWLRAQIIGLRTTALKLSGQAIDYLTEVELCYGVKPRRVPPEEIEEARSVLDRVIPGKGELAARLISYRESFATPPEKLDAILRDLSEVFREQTGRAFGLPRGEALDFELVKSKPWSGFNYYLGGFRSRVAINIDLPVLSTSLAHLVAHEAYPGHHTEHTRKERDLVNRNRQFEESIFLVGTPQCLIAEGLADFGLEALFGDRHFEIVSQLMIKRGINYPDQELSEARYAFETLGKVRANAAWDLHQNGVQPNEVIEMMERDALLSGARAQKAVEFLLDPTWRAYITCYVEGYQLVRSFVGSVDTVSEVVRQSRFKRLISEQLIPEDLLSI